MSRHAASQSVRRPVVAVLCSGGERDGRRVQFVAERFVEPLAAAGMSALLVPAMAEAVDAVAIAQRCDALLMTGSVSNVSASRYGGVCAGRDVDEGRDEVALAVSGAMIDAGRPVLGICRGMQELCVAFGGSLLEIGGDLHMRGEWPCPTVFDHTHGVDLVEGGMLHAMAGSASVPVASAHRQGVSRLGSGLMVEATAPDGLVEAFSSRPRGLVIGVQWHPERRAGPLDRALFDEMRMAA